MFKTNASNWTTHSDSELTPLSITELFSNKIPIIRVKNFATKEECKKFQDSLKDINLNRYEQLDPPIFKLGLSQFEAGEMGSKGKKLYFNEVGYTDKKINEIFDAINFNPIERLISILSDVLEKKPRIAQEDNLGKYFSGIIRQSDRSIKLHADFGPLNGPGWKIEQVLEQLAVNFFITEPDYGGHTTVYNQPWNKKDEEAGRVSNCYSYYKNLVQGAQYKIIAPKAGDLVLFNSRNYHEVEISINERFTISTFIGRMPNNDFLLWS